MSTSGSTGSPKLVRLSRCNLVANAKAIADYLDLRQTDRAATTLPMSYCYGLSVVHSHLLRGAGLILTDRSVVDDGVLDAVPQAPRHVVRRCALHVRNAGADRLRRHRPARSALRHPGRWAAVTATRTQLRRTRGDARAGSCSSCTALPKPPPGWPTCHRSSHSRIPTSIGLPIPGGSFTLEPHEGWSAPDVGELVYHGPNVMMGYAHGPADLALGKTVETLRTGDVARRTPDGLYEVIGRSSRFVKLYGLRIDLQRVEAALSEDGRDSLLHRRRRAARGCRGRPDIACRATHYRRGVRPPRGRRSGHQHRPSCRCCRRASRTTRPSGTSRIERCRAGEAHPATCAPCSPMCCRSIRGRSASDQSFVDLGGNSLSYVAMSVRLERALGRLPADWQQRSLGELERMTPPERRSWPWLGATLETSVALRAAAIVLIVGSHATLYEMWGGAHLLLGIAGYNFGRFCLTPVARTDRVRHLRKTIAWIVVPSLTWIAVALLITDDYHWTNLLPRREVLRPRTTA